MPKKQTGKMYPETMFVHTDAPECFVAHHEPGAIMNLHELDAGSEVAIYKFDRMAKVTRTVKVE